jgi:hypothetical protein
VDFAVDIVAGWVQALEAQYGPGEPGWDRYEAAIQLVEQAQLLVQPERKLRLVK